MLCVNASFVIAHVWAHEWKSNGALRSGKNSNPMLNPMAKLDIHLTHHLCLYCSSPIPYIFFYLNISTSSIYCYVV